MACSYRFGDFRFDPDDRQLHGAGGTPVELNARYLDALALLVREQGRLVSKDRFMEEVWRGVPVTDEALTQCVRTLRRQLGDDAASPRFIETVPKHGYRFIAAVERFDRQVSSAAPRQPGFDWRRTALLGGAGAIGGGFAGMAGGLLYGLVGVSQPLQPGMGAASVLLVLVCLSILVGLMGGVGVGLGLAASGFGSRRAGPWTIVGGAAGGMAIGAFAKLLGLDAFNLLLGQSPGDITGAGEGALLGGAIGLGAWLAGRGAGPLTLRRGFGAAALAGGVAGIAIPLLGGRLMAGSLGLLAERFPTSRLQLDQLGFLLGERGFGPISQAATGALEGAMFGGCLVGAMILAMRSLDGGR